MGAANSLAALTGFLMTLTLASSFIIVGARRLGSAIRGAVVQAVLLAAVTAVRGWSTGVGEMYLAAGLTLIVKAGLIPYILHKVEVRVGSCPGVKSYVNMKMSFVTCAGLIILSYSATARLVEPGIGVVERALPTAVAMMLIGLFLMMTRKLAINQVVGLLVMENGIFLAAVGATNGMPPVVEVGVFLDVLAGVLIMGILAFRINRAFDTINTEDLRNLRG